MNTTAFRDALVKAVRDVDYPVVIRKHKGKECWVGDDFMFEVRGGPFGKTVTLDVHTSIDSRWFKTSEVLEVSDAGLEAAISAVLGAVTKLRDCE